MTNNRVPSIIQSPLPSSALQWLATSDINLKTAQVAGLQFGYLVGEKRVNTATVWYVCVIRTVTMCHKMEVRKSDTESG